MATIDKHSYAHMFGPTIGDRVRLGDTDLWLEVEKDFTLLRIFLRGVTSRLCKHFKVTFHLKVA